MNRCPKQFPISRLCIFTSTLILLKIIILREIQNSEESKEHKINGPLKQRPGCYAQSDLRHDVPQHAGSAPATSAASSGPEATPTGRVACCTTGSVALPTAASRRCQAHRGAARARLGRGRHRAAFSASAPHRVQPCQQRADAGEPASDRRDHGDARRWVASSIQRARK